MKKLLIGAAIAAAAMFTACDESSSESSSSVGSCDISVSMMGGAFTTHVCGESSDMASIKADCDSAQALFSAPVEDDYGFEEGDADFDLGALLGSIDGSAKYGSGCPSGYKNKCVDEDGVTTYYYDKDAASMTCEELLAEEDEYGF